MVPLRLTSSWEIGLTPLNGALSRGEGRLAIAASSNGPAPMLRTPEAQAMGNTLRAITAARSPFSISSCDSSPFSKNRSISWSSVSAIASTSRVRAVSVSSFSGAGISACWCLPDSSPGL